MIICRRCSRRHADGTEFCTCGAYLEFDGERAPDEAGPPTADTSRPDAGGATTATPTTTATGGPVVGDTSPWSGLPGERTDDGTRAIRPDERGAAGPASDEITAPMTVRPDAIPCPSCRNPNPPDATFCRHCAHDLRRPSGIVAAERPAKRSWFGRRRVDPRQLARQARRPGGGGVTRRVMMMRAGGALIGVGVLVMFLGPWGRPALAKMREELRLTRYDQIEVDGDDVSARALAGATGAAPDLPYHTPDLVVDGLSNTSWATRWIDPADIGDDLPEDGCVAWRTEQLLEVDFGSPTSIDRVEVLAGRSVDDPTRDDFHRPRVLQFDHAGDCRRVTVDDEGELTAHDLSLDDVTTLMVGIVAIYEGDTTDATIEITELVFEQK